MFSDATLHHLVSSRSDHCPLMLEIKKESWERHKPRIFRYEIMWERLESLAVEIKEAWCSAPSREGLGGIACALKCAACVEGLEQGKFWAGHERIGWVAEQVGGHEG